MSLFVTYTIILSITAVNVFSAFNPSKCTHTWSSGHTHTHTPHTHTHPHTHHTPHTHTHTHHTHTPHHTWSSGTHSHTHTHTPHTNTHTHTHTHTWSSGTHTHTPHTHLEQWATTLRRPGSNLGVDSDLRSEVYSLH